MTDRIPARKILIGIGFAATQAAIIAGFILVWQYGANNGSINQFTFGSPSGVWNSLQDLAASGSLWGHIWETIKILLLGQLIGTLAGTLLGVGISFSPYLREILEPFIVFLNATPRLILYPFFVVWLGFSSAPKIITVALVVFTLVMINIASGLREVQGSLVDNIRVLGANRLHLIRDVYGPSLTLWLLSTTRVTMTYAFQATIATQFLGADKGLGYLVNFGRQRFQIDLVYASIVVILIIALVLHAILGSVERRTTRWMST
ncbi:ABC transporter permease [Rhodococcus globerulus]|uniref:ABC transporter permease n=1 Tax=Rhodococcus globerulus TaxID=33008 RepID=A0ABU4C5R9_RHOGO|nr:ABC transporter permease [Rhodococcus globerulus]MDV6271601.1 ABC transporter permease [Rhodococcus globerulus]